MKYILMAFVFYLLYKLVFDFILPVSRATSQVRSKIQEMQEHQMRQQQAAQGPIHTNTTRSQAAAPVSRKDDDYIDFEEIKG